MTIRSTFLAVMAVALMGLALPSGAQAAAFLKLEGVPGEATDDGHKDWINLLSVSWGSTRMESTSDRAGTATKSTDSKPRQSSSGDVVCVKEVDASTPKLQEALLTGRPFPSAVLDVEDKEGKGYLRYELTNVLVSSYQSSASGDTVPTETLSLNYEKISLAKKTLNVTPEGIIKQ